MDFYDIVGQVLELLQHQGRVSYRALKRQFDVDDDFIEDLKEELCFSHPVVDEGGRGLVWTGETSTQPEPVSISQPVQPGQESAAQQDQPTHEPSFEPPTPEAERRQLTVMFCDLVDSTKLSSQLDPEDYREVVREYQKVCAEVITRFDGHIAQYLGDGLLVYFGYPVAHEEDAQRAIHTGLGIVGAIGTLNTRLEQTKGIKLAVRLGVHTGLVVVGEMGGKGRQEQLALGETPNVAARIQGLAEPDTVVISDATYRLIQGYFDCQELGEQILRGVAQPITVYRVLGKTGTQSRIAIAATRGLTPLVGREQEVGLLLERWAQAKDGQGQVILLSGEAGIGKSRLVQVLREHVADEPHTRWECRSSPYYQNSALYPMTDLLQRILHWQQDDTPEERLGKLEQTLSPFRLSMEGMVPLFAPLLSIPLPENRYPPLNLAPQRQRQKTLESIMAILLELAEREPVLFILEDLHWTDPTTLEFLGLLVEQVPTASIYTLLTCRPHFQPAWHHRSYLTEITVNRLSQNQIERMAQHVAGGKTLPTEIIQQLVDKTDGVPLYVEEMTKAVLESGHPKETDGVYELTGSLSSLAIPATLQDSLMARLDRLVSAKGVAQLAAVIDRQFSYALLQAVSQLDEMMLQRELGRLVEAELVYQRGLPLQATYTFKHALIQDAAYQSLLKSTRQQYHQRVARVLEVQFPETGETQPELLAHHYTEAGLIEQAIDAWYKAGQKASERSANVEATGYLTKGLDCIDALPEASRNQHELRLLLLLGPALTFTKGHTSAESQEAYARAQALCQQTGETAKLLDVLYGLRRFYANCGELYVARKFAEQALNLADAGHDQVASLFSHYSLAFVLYRLGELPEAFKHFTRGLVLSEDLREYAPDRFIERVGVDSRLTCRITSANALWLLGYPEQARKRVAETLQASQTLSHPSTHVVVLLWAKDVYDWRRETLLAQELAQELRRLGRELNYETLEVIGNIEQSFVLALQGQAQEHLWHMRQGITDLQTRFPNVSAAYYLLRLASAYATVGQSEAGLATLAEAMARIEQTEERFYEAELHRLQGALLLQQSSDNAPEAEACFHQAIAIAQNQSAKSWELRAATSLAKLWQRQGKRQEAYDLLEPVYGWFTEGFDTADLQDAKALLDELEDGR